MNRKIEIIERLDYAPDAIARTFHCVVCDRAHLQTGQIVRVWVNYQEGYSALAHEDCVKVNYYAKIEAIIKDVDCDGITYSGAIVTYTDDAAQPYKFTRKFPNTHAAAEFARTLPNCFIVHNNGNTERTK